MTVALADFYETIGCAYERVEEGLVRIRVANRVGLRNSRGEIHGGVVAGLTDIAASRAARTTLGPNGALATASMAVTFIAPATGPVICAEGRVLRAGGTLATVAVTIRNGERGTDDEPIVASGLATIRLFRRDG